MMHNVKKQTKDGRKYLWTIYLMKGYYPKYIKNYNLIQKPKQQEQEQEQEQ